MSSTDIQEAIKQILRKAASDAGFRAKVLQDPAAALKELGVELPAGQKIKFVEKLEEVVIELPPLGDSDEITDDETLRSAAGGSGSESATRFTCRRPQAC